jgi:hypothetical protein
MQLRCNDTIDDVLRLAMTLTKPVSPGKDNSSNVPPQNIYEQFMDPDTDLMDMSFTMIGVMGMRPPSKDWMKGTCHRRVCEHLCCDGFSDVNMASQ